MKSLNNWIKNLVLFPGGCRKTKIVLSVNGAQYISFMTCITLIVQRDALGEVVETMGRGTQKKLCNPAFVSGVMLIFIPCEP
jgi:hypothetical protein